MEICSKILTMGGNTHEDYRRQVEIRASSDRSFGLISAAALIVIALWPTWRGESPRILPLGAALVLVFLALAVPACLHTFNMMWVRCGVLLGKIVSPLVLGVMFFAVFTPGAIGIRILGRDLLRLRRTDDESYWTWRVPPGPAPETAENQF